MFVIPEHFLLSRDHVWFVRSGVFGGRDFLRASQPKWNVNKHAPNMSYAHSDTWYVVATYQNMFVASLVRVRWVYPPRRFFGLTDFNRLLRTQDRKRQDKIAHKQRIRVHTTCHEPIQLVFSCPACAMQRKHVLSKLRAGKTSSISISFDDTLNLTPDSSSAVENTSSIKVWQWNEQFSNFVGSGHYFCPWL